MIASTSAAAWALLLVSLCYCAYRLVHYQNRDKPLGRRESVPLSQLEHASLRTVDTVHALDEELPAVAIDQVVQKAQVHGDQLKLGEACGATAATKEGQLAKRSTKGQWQTRYVALSSTHLVYAASKKQRKRTRFALPLENVTSVAAWHDADSFVVTSARGNELTLRASSAAGAQDWMAAIRGAVSDRCRDRHKLRREEDYLDASERAKVEALRVRCKDEPCLQRDHLLEDANLVRFVRARDGNVNKAEKMLRDHGQWRDDYGFPALLAAGKTPEDAFIQRWWPDGLLEGSDLKGRPVQLIRLGKADLPGIEREVGRKKWIEYCCLKNEALFEEIRKRCLAQNTFETSAPLIMDMRDLGTHHAWGVPLFKAMLDVTEPNFPERLSATYIVNAPAVFSWLYGMVKGFLNPGTAAKVQVFGASDDHLKALLEVMPLSTIPIDLGGEAPLPKNVSVGGTVPKGALADLRGTPGEPAVAVDRAVAEPEPETWGAYDTRVAEGEK